MRYKKYPKYKDSGIEWIGKIPEGWTNTLLKRRFDVQLGKMLQPQASSPQDTLEPYLCAANIQWKSADLSVIKHMWFSPTDKGKYLLRAGDLLVSEGGDVGRSCIWQVELPRAFFQNAINRIRSKGVDSISFLYYWIYCVKHAGYIGVLCNKATIPHFTADKVQNLPILLPTPAEQLQITTFLDHKTYQIDSLIANKQRLIELLEEKRSALITQSVTKGLDPDVAMKDSGVEWIGEIPEEWKATQLRYVASCLDGKRVPLSAEERSKMQGNIPYWGANGVIDYVNDWLIDNEVVLLGEDGAPFFDRCKPVAFYSKGKIWPNNHIHILLPLKNTTPKFLMYALNATDYTNYIDGSTRDKLTQFSMKKICIPIPSVQEQQSIATFLDHKTSQIDSLITDIQRSITLLEEYKQSLVTAAVTGKIDVRDERSEQIA